MQITKISDKGEERSEVLPVEKVELEKYGFSEGDGDIICRNDLFLIEHYEKLFYMTPIELAQAINGMGEDEIIRFNNAVRDYGNNSELMREKIDDMAKYVTVNPIIFGEAVLRSQIFEAGEFNTLKEMYSEKTRPRMSLVPMLFGLYQEFREHFFKLKTEGIITETETGLKWNRSEISIAEYFDRLKCNNHRIKWISIKKVFDMEDKDLCQYLRNHKERQAGKPSRDFVEIKQILGLN